MNVVTAIGISGIADFKKSVLKVEPGITYLYGKNMLKHGNGNAAGKSVFASSVADIFYDTPMVGERQDKVKSGIRFVEFKRGSKLVRVQQSYAGRAERLKIQVDGEERKGATATKTRSLLPKLWPITEEEYRTYGYLDANVPHDLVMGNSAKRKAFFTSFFQLDRLDAEKKVLAAYMSELKKVRARWNELNTTFQAVKSDMLKKEQRLVLESQVSDLEARLRKLRAKSDRAQEVQSLLEFERFSAPQLKKLRALCPDLDLIEEQLDQVRHRIKKATKASDQMDEWRLYRKELEQWTQASEGLDTKTPIESLEEASTQYSALVAKAQSLSDIKHPGSAPERVAKPEHSKEDLARDQVKLGHLKSHSKKFGRGVCGECGQAVKTADPEQISKLEAKCEALSNEWRQYERYVAKREAYKSELETFERNLERKLEAESGAKILKPEHVLYKKRLELGDRPTKVEKPEGVEDVEPLREQVTVLEFGAQHLESIRALEQLKPEDRELKFDPQKMDQLQDKMSSAKTRLQVHNTVKGRATEMKNRLAELDGQLAEEEALSFALEAYSDKAIKRMAVEAISEQMMAKVNQLSALVFESYRFEFVWDTQVKILVHRGSKAPTDVRKLSGAESKLFTLILVFSLLMFVPSSKRLSLLILDEPCASFHEDTIALFHTLLPHMLTLIPSILVVTPKQYERYEGAREYTVYRDQTGASLKKGHPSHVGQ